MTKEVEARFRAVETKIERLQDFVKPVTTVINCSTEFKQFDCANCGNPFILNSSQYRRRLNKGAKYYCAAGHINIFH